MLASIHSMLLQLAVCIVILAATLQLPTVGAAPNRKPDVPDIRFDGINKGSMTDEPRKQEKSIRSEYMTKHEDYEDDLFIDDDDDPPESRTVEGMVDDAGPEVGSGTEPPSTVVSSTPTSPSSLTFLDAELQAGYSDDSIGDFGSGRTTNIPKSSGTKCQKLRNRALAGNQVFYKPDCEENGDYKPLQCKDDSCWCADADGRVIPYTRTRITDTPPNCAGQTGKTGYWTDKKPPTRAVDLEVLTTRSTKTTTPAPTVGQQTAAYWLFMRTDILAGIFVGTGVGLVCAVILVICIVHRMKKKDEGSYALDEPRRPPPCQQTYQRAPTKEVYA